MNGNRGNMGVSGNDRNAGKGNAAQWTQSIQWLSGDDTLVARCPACGCEGPKPVRLRVAAPLPFYPLVDGADPRGVGINDRLAVRAVELAWCPNCGSAFNPTMEQPPYEAVLDPISDCYVEQNAGIDGMASLLTTLDPSRVSRFLEIGCGFGFILDYAQAVHGWTAKGFDPGLSARVGREVLGVDIELDYLLSPEQAGAEPYDFVLGSEVIEHVFDPDAFLAVLRQVVATDGTLILTTPNAAAIRPETKPGTLLSLLCPSYHVVLYSAAGLEAVLRRAGFTHVTVVDLGHTLRAAASMSALQVNFSRPLDRRQYIDYLRVRTATTAPSTPMGIGFRYRLLKELVNLGDYAAGKAAVPALVEACRTGWGLDLGDPAALIGVMTAAALDASVEDHHRTYPFCFGNILYFLGLLAWQADQDPERACLWFDAAAVAGERMRAALHTLGADDEETEELGWRARLHAASALVTIRPEAALDRIEAVAGTPSPILGEHVPPAILIPARAQLLVDLVNTGRYELAQRLEPAVLASADVVGAAAPFLYFALGILELVHRGNPAGAAARFAEAQRLVEGSAGAAPGLARAVGWPACFHEAMALGACGNKVQALALLDRLVAEPAGPGGPDDGLRERASALSTELRSA